MIGGTISSRVKAVLNARIAKAEKDYQEGVDQHHETYKAEKQAAKEKRENNKSALADRLVKDIIGSSY